MDVAQSGELEHHCFGTASQPRQSRRQNEGQQFVSGGLIAQGNNPRLVFSNRLEYLAEGRLDNAVN
ncbi:hypothetical protein D3C84_1152360 [compost metagenome]